MMSVENLIEKLAKEVEGVKGAEENILVFTLSTCMWCKKCKRFLNERNLKYRYIDVDKINLKCLDLLTGRMKDTKLMLLKKNKILLKTEPKSYKPILLVLT